MGGPPKRGYTTLLWSHGGVAGPQNISNPLYGAAKFDSQEQAISTLKDLIKYGRVNIKHITICCVTFSEKAKISEEWYPKHMEQFKS